MSTGISCRDTTVIIPAAGLDASGQWQMVPKAMQGVLGKPFILLIFERLISQGFRSFVVVENPQSDSIRTLLSFVYSWNKELQIKFLKQEKLTGPLTAVAAAVDLVPSKDMLIWLGDTYCSSPLDFTEDALLTSEVGETFRWCIADMNSAGRIVGFRDKVAHSKNTTELALAGVYYISDARRFFSCVRQIMDSGPAPTGYFEISQALTAYMPAQGFKAIPIEGWVDAGNQDMLLSTFGRLFAARSFNHMQYQPETNVITKTSDERSRAKLRNEVHWMVNVPGHCRRFIPAVVDSSMDAENTHLSLEFAVFPPLSSSYVFHRLPLQKWRWALSKVMGGFQRFFWSQQHPSPQAGTALFQQVFGNLEKRLALYPAHIPKGRRLTCDGAALPSIDELLPRLRSRVESLCKGITALSIAHGDLCFSNILFDMNSGLFKVVDPRGSFGNGEPSLYGHPLYDLAKLRHSIAGGYDSLAYDLFHLSEVQGTALAYNLTVHKNPVHEELTSFFDGEVARSGLLPADVAAIEACLFLSMVPLHDENPRRQLAMYLTGLRRAQEVLS